jgi:hypothetical protein
MAAESSTAAVEATTTAMEPAATAAKAAPVNFTHMAENEDARNERGSKTAP